MLTVFFPIDSAVDSGECSLLDTMACTSNTLLRFYMYPIPVAIVGYLIFMFTDSFGPRYFSTFLFVFVFAMNGTIYSWIAGAIPRPPAKRAAAYAFINSVGNSASIWTPFTYRPKDAPHY